MADVIFPTNAELELIAQDLLPRMMVDRPEFKWFPVANEDAFLVMWEQRDNWQGLQQVRGLNGEPGKVSRLGSKRYLMQPGVYGEFTTLDEMEMTVKRSPGTFATPIDVTDLVAREEERLLMRRIDRISTIIWTLLVTGTFSVAGPTGAVLHTDSYTTQTYSAAVTWVTSATATPLADLRAIQLLHRGHSVDFGSRAVAYMNRITFNQMISNTNAADIYGRRTQGLGTINSPEQLNQLLAMDDLPNFQVYDEGYLAEPSGTFTPYIPNNKVVVVGKRLDNSPIGEYKMVRNANNPGLAPGAYMKIVDNGDRAVPRLIQVHDGHNGGPALYFPSAIVVMTV
jgi:hypothetical protein